MRYLVRIKHNRHAMPMSVQQRQSPCRCYVSPPLIKPALSIVQAHALWQLVGFFLGWSGYHGKGRALGAGEVKFTGEIKPDSKKVLYKLSMSRLIDRKLVVGIADGTVSVDGKVIYTTKALKVGLFTPEQSF